MFLGNSLGITQTQFDNYVWFGLDACNCLRRPVSDKIGLNWLHINVDDWKWRWLTHKSLFRSSRQENKQSRLEKICMQTSIKLPHRNYYGLLLLSLTNLNVL
jgi:hypothetical protein